MDPAVTYGSYLHIDELLTLQKPRSEGPEHDELLFIVIHQVYELWFKEILHEIDRVKLLLEGDDSHRAQHTLKRVLTILKVLVAQLDILETMTPLEFLSFRARLEAASGFQSDQFRQLEFALGRKSRAIAERYSSGVETQSVRGGGISSWAGFGVYCPAWGIAPRFIDGRAGDGPAARSQRRYLAVRPESAVFQRKAGGGRED